MGNQNIMHEDVDHHGSYSITIHKCNSNVQQNAIKNYDTLGELFGTSQAVTLKMLLIYG